MTQEQLQQYHLPLGIYRIHWRIGGSSVAAVGHDASGNYWFAPTNWISIPWFDWKDVKRLQLIDTQEILVGKDWTESRQAVEKVNAHGQTQSCRECGAPYPQVERIDGHVCCPKCRVPNLPPPCLSRYAPFPWQDEC